MRKVLGSITLLVLVFNTLLTPLTYAEEYEEIIETSSENTAEEVVEETGEEESSSEFSVEEENTDEEKDEEKAEEGEEGAGGTEDDETITGDVAEEGTGDTEEIETERTEGLTGENEELTGDAEAEIGTGTIAEEGTGYAEGSTGDIEELTGGVEDEIGTGATEEIVYNKESIIGERTYNDVTVKVEALSGIFPEGTELKIEPIKWWNLSNLKDKLVEEQAEVNEDTTVVAFDITFIYSGEEVQPREGEKVKVTFDYSNNEDLVEADKQENQEVKVYHIEDKDEEGNELEKGEEKIVDVTNKEESEEEGIAVADVESFSIYAVLKTAIDATITYNLNGGYWTEGGIDSTGSKEIVYTLGNPVEYFKTPSKAGNTCEGKKCMFDGWYTDQEGTTKWNGDPSTATTVYAKWLPFEDLHTYLLINENNIIHKTLMDRNMGATKVYNNVNDNATLGYQYQWGNNYGFPAINDIKSYKYITVQGGSLSDNIWGKGVSSKYYRNYFDNTKDENWMNNSTTYNMKNMWGGAGDTCEAEGVGTTQENRQGPCPDGYHVPSIYEWGQVYSGWAKATSKKISDQNNRNELSKDLLLPNNINRRKGGSFSNESKYVGINYASSSLDNDNKYYGIYITSHEAQLCGLTDNSNMEATSTSRPVRCFKNSENGSSYLSRIYLKGGTGGTISIVSGEVKALRKPQRGTATFYGWYTTSDYSGSPIETGSVLQQGDSLYAKWCQDPLVDNGTECVYAKTITFDTDGGSDVPTQYITPGGTGTRPTDPEKDGYTFLGWYTDNTYATGFDFDTPITSNITVYAKWNLMDYTITYELNDGTVTEANPTRYTIESGDIILNNPSKDGYGFEGWSGTNLPECSIEDALNCVRNVTVSKGSTGDRTYEAIWGYVRYDLIFDSIGGSDVASQRVIKGRTGTRPTDPEKDGYTFGGWYYTGLENEFDFEEPIISNITVYAKWNLVDYHITYELNGGTGLTNTGIYTIETDSFTLNNPSKLNYEFIGWSGTNLSGCSVENQTTCNTTVTVEQGSVGNRVYEAIYDCAYGRKLDGTCNIAKGEDGLIDYENWEYNDLEVDLSVTDPVKIVIMDRNLGAAVSGVEENAFGFYYQWGNNYGFRNVIEKTSTEQVDASAYGPENYYISDTFILQDSLGWDAPVNYNLWGGTGDTTSKRGDGDDEARQGPCPSGYHVPSILEWHKLNSFANTWRNSENATDVCSEFDDNRQCVLSKFLKLPRAGNILGKDGSFQPYDGGYLGRYWSSSRHNDNRAYRYRINGNWDISQGLSNNTDNYSYYNSQGMSVRCFKNVSSKPIVYELSGGVQTSNQTSTVVWWNESAGKTLTIPTKTGFVFEGWYLTSGYEKGTRVTKNVISDYSDNESVILYANWKNPEYKTIIYNANGGYFSGGLLSTGIVFKEHTVSGNYMALTNVQFPNREGYMFDGWYLTGGETEWTGYVNNSTEEQTVYAKWLSFDDLTVTMSGITFTLMDRNLGATDFATGYTYGSDNEQSNQSRRGKYYQWGNNYGFSDSGNSSSSNKIDNTDNFGPGNYFSNAVYIWNGRVWGNVHHNLWGGQYQSSGDETRQGPCPVSYHVPTKDEWDRSLALFNVWKQTEEGITYCNSLVNSGDMYCFSAKLGLPFAGYLEGANNLKSIGTFGTYWSSTKSGYTDPYRLRLGNMRTETLSNGYGNSIRCFKDTQKRELIFDSKGGSKIDFMQTVRWWETTSSLPIPTRSNSTFTGWYTTSGYEEGTKVSVNYVGTGLGPVTLYAKWECNEGYEESEDGNSCTSFSYTITYDSTTNGGTKEEQTEGVEYGAHPSLSLYTGYKEGWTFVGWNTNSGATYGLNSDEITITSDIILYAIYRKEAKILGIVSYPLNGDGITYNEGHDYGFTCTLPEVFNNEEQDTSCTVSMPFVTINDWSRREFIGVNSDSGATENASNIVWETYDYEIPGFKTPVYSGTITLTEETSGKKWYIISKYPSLILTGNFHGNGSTILGEISTGCTIGEIYNKAQEITSCEVDMPRVTPNTDTPIFVGWNTNSGATENDGVSYNNITNKLTLSLANGEEQDWYAITKSEGKRYTATYVTDNRVEENITEPAYCDIAETYNGEAQLEECPTPIVLPTLTAKVGYYNPIWKLGTVEYEGGAQIVLSGNVNLTGTATPDEHTPYIVKHYYQTLTNTNEYQLSGLDTLSGETESLLTLSQLQKEASSILGFTYRQARVNGEVATIIDVTTIQDFTGQAEIQSGLVIQLFYTRKNNPVTLHQIGNATVEKTPSKDSYYYGETITFSGHADAGYTFSGWDIREGEGETGRREGTRIEYTMINTGVNVTPVIREHKYTIHYNASGAVGTIADRTVNYSEVVYLPTAEEVAIQYTYTGHHFAGWTTGDVVISTLTKATPVDNGEVILNAKWEENEGVAYSVKHYLEPIAKGRPHEEYELKDTYDGTAPQGTTVTGALNNYPGFTSPAAQEVQVVTEGTTIKYYYTRNSYDYTFVAGEGAEFSDGATSKTVSFRYEQSVVLPGGMTLVKTGFTFSNWNPVLGPMPSDAKTSTAEWTENQYTINYNANGGTGETPTQKVRYTEEVALTGNAFIKTGYTFTGWSETAEGSVVYKDKAQVSKLTGVNNAIVTLYAQWSADSYIVTFDANSGDVAYLTKKVTYDSTYGTLPIATRTGYDFKGWYTEKVGGEKVTEATKVITAAAHTLYAQWESKTYTVTFDAEGGEVTPATKEVTYDGEYGELPTVTATGFSFAGWYTGDKIITEATKVTIAADHTLQAHWTENEYTIEFNANGGEGTMPTQRVSYTDEVNLTGNTYKREGYQFIGWSRTENGEKVFNDKQTVTRLASEDNATVILYAVWEKGAYSIAYNLNGGSLPAGADNPEAYDVETANFTLVNPIRTGYTFEGWSGTGIPTLSTEVTIMQGSTGNRVYEANWKAIEYGITYNLNDGVLSGEQTNPAIYTIETASFTLENPIRTGYTFKGWSGTALTEPTETVTITEGSIGAREYEAVWSINRYTITWNNRDGTELEKDENVPYGTMPSYNKADPEKTGDAQYSYTFTGWTPLIKAVTKDQVYTAVYEQTVNKYPVTFYDEDGEAVLKETKLYPYGTLSGGIDRPETPSKASDGTYNYEFIGWTPEVATVTTGVDYRATYKATYIEYLVSFKGSTGAILASGYYHSGEMPAVPANPQKASTAQYEYTFAGWNPEVSVVTGNITYTPTYDETIRSYTITWLNDDDTVIDTTTVEYGVTPTHADASKANTAEYTYTFSGWTPEITSVEGEAIYKATYTSTKNKYTITWKNEDGTVIDTTEVEYGAMPIHADASKANTQEYTYTFSGWTPEITSVKGEATYQAVFAATKNSYTVVFKNEDGTSLQSTEVPYGETPVYNGGTPTSGSTAEYDYTFAGWTPEIKTVTGPAEYTATYTANKRSYTITWKNEDGTVIDTTTVEYGKIPVQPTIPSKTFTEQTGYAFNGWTPGIVAVTGETTYTATYAEYLREYTILWRDRDGKVIATGENIQYGTVIVDNKPGDPDRESTAQTGYVFTGWYDEAGIKLIDTKLLTGDMEYTAKYDEKIRTYTIIWNNRDGTELHRDEKQPYGTHIGYTGPVPTSGSTEQYSYTHKGWMPEVHNVLGPQVYTADYESTIRSYPVTFYDEDGTTVIEGPTMYKYGTTSGTYKPTTNPTKEGYSFSKWTPDLEPVVGTASYTASYIINSYNITPIKGVGVANIIGGGSYPYNSTVTLTGIAKEGYHFEGGVSEKAFTYTVPSHDTTLQISAEPNKYYIHFNGNGGVGTMEDQEFTYDEEQSLAPNVYTYNGYYFMSWTDGNGGIYKDNSIVKNLATTGVVTLIAQWGDNPGPTPPGPTPTPTPSGGGSGGGGGGKRIDKDTEEHASAEVETGSDEVIEDKEEKNKSEIRTGTHNLPSKSGTTIKSTDDVQIPATRTQEEMDAYKYAYKYGITTLAPKEAARPDEYVQRGHMAKMVVNYALNVLHRKLPAKLPKQCKWKDGPNAWDSKEIKDYAEKACALGLMGIDMEYFQPYKLVTRAQFGTVFGRLLWGKLNSKPYYVEHLARLRKRGIMTQIDRPEERIEVRKWAWLMFMRSEKYFKIDK